MDAAKVRTGGAMLADMLITGALVAMVIPRLQRKKRDDIAASAEGSENNCGLFWFHLLVMLHCSVLLYSGTSANYYGYRPTVGSI